MVPGNGEKEDIDGRQKLVGGLFHNFEEKYRTPINVLVITAKRLPLSKLSDVEEPKTKTL